VRLEYFEFPVDLVNFSSFDNATTALWISYCRSSSFEQYLAVVSVLIFLRMEELTGKDAKKRKVDENKDAVTPAKKKRKEYI
jgi:hypothetical protein